MRVSRWPSRRVFSNHASSLHGIIEKTLHYDGRFKQAVENNCGRGRKIEDLNKCRGVGMHRSRYHANLFVLLFLSLYVSFLTVEAGAELIANPACSGIPDDATLAGEKGITGFYEWLGENCSSYATYGNPPYCTSRNPQDSTSVGGGCFRQEFGYATGYWYMASAYAYWCEPNSNCQGDSATVDFDGDGIPHDQDIFPYWKLVLEKELGGPGEDCEP